MNESEATRVEKQATLTCASLASNSVIPPIAAFAMGDYSTIGLFTLFSWVADEGLSLSSREPRTSHVTFLTPHHQLLKKNHMVGCQTSPWDKLVSSESD